MLSAINISALHTVGVSIAISRGHHMRRRNTCMYIMVAGAVSWLNVIEIIIIIILDGNCFEKLLEPEHRIGV